MNERPLPQDPPDGGAPSSRWLNSFGADESGATLTEFVIVLPVFILIFAGIMKVTLLQSSTVQLKMAATEELWERASEVQRGTRAPDDHTQPGAAGPASRNIVNRSQVENDFSDDADRSMAVGTLQNGLTGRADAALDTPYGRTDIRTQARLQDLPPSTGSSPAPDVDNIVRRRNAGINYSASPWTERLVDGTSNARRPPNAPPPVGDMNISPQGDQSVPAFAAGIRYGLVTSDERVKQSVIDALPGYSTRDQLRAGYDTLVAPVPITTGPERFRPVGMSRRFMERHPGQLSELLGIEMSSNYLP